jgi:hypothetical protein
MFAEEKTFLRDHSYLVAGDRSSISSILDDNHELSLNLVSFTVCFVGRCTNVVVHHCAKFACTDGSSQVWLMTVCPHCF